MAAISIWKYEPEQLATIDIRSSPDINGARTAEKLHPGDVFEVSEEIPSAAGVTFLRLADGRGWVFDTKPGFGTMCVRVAPAADEGFPQYAAAPVPTPIQAAQVTAHVVPTAPPSFPGTTPMLPGTLPIHSVLFPSGAPHPSAGLGPDANIWVQRYGLPSLETRAVPDIDGPRTGHLLMPGESFLVAEELMRPSGVRYLRLADGRGWAFDYKPGIGPMCARQAHSGLQPAPLPSGGLGGVAVPPVAGGLLPSASFVAAPPLPAPGAGGLHPSASFVGGAAPLPLAPFGPALLQAPAPGPTPQGIALGATTTHSMAAPPTRPSLAPPSPLPTVFAQVPGAPGMPPAAGLRPCAAGGGLAPVAQYTVPPEAAPTSPLDVSTSSLADRLQPRHLGTRVTVYR